MVAGANWRKEIRENELSAWQAEISARDQREEELRRFLNALSTVRSALIGMQ